VSTSETCDSPPADPYEAILELAERELELAGDGRIEDLRALAEEWDQLTAGLPARPPASARRPLERAAALHRSTSATLSPVGGDALRHAHHRPRRACCTRLRPRDPPPHQARRPDRVVLS